MEREEEEAGVRRRGNGGRIEKERSGAWGKVRGY